jgi:hypothetical protein
MVILPTVAPKGWPSTTPGWHVYGVHDEKTSGVVVLRLYPDALAVSRDLCSGFNLHDDVSGGIHTNESVGLLKTVIKDWFDGAPCVRQEKRPTASCMLRKVTSPVCGH